MQGLGLSGLRAVSQPPTSRRCLCSEASFARYHGGYVQLILDNLRALHAEEEKLRLKALGLVARDSQLQLHISVIGNAMNLADLFRQFPTDDEDMQAIQLLGMRAFNAFGSSLKLALSGYGQSSALIMRLILEIVFLLELLEGDRSLIERWRCADEKERKEKFWPAPVRNALAARGESRG